VLAFTSTWAPAQTNAAPDTNAPAGDASYSSHVHEVPQPDQTGPAPGNDSSANVDPAKIAEYQQRFKHGLELEQKNQLKEARDVFDGILAEQPDAKGSLLEAGRVNFALGEPEKAEDYWHKLYEVVGVEQLERMHEQIPNFPDIPARLIEMNQSMKRDVRVAFLIHDFKALHDSGRVPEFSSEPLFVRERIHLGPDEVVVSQFFDYTQDPNTVWMAEEFDPTGQLIKRILLNYDVAATQALRAKDAKYANAQVFTWFGHVIKDQHVKEIDAYLQIFALPDYAKFRSAMLMILAEPPKPIYSAPVDVPL
jgi:tetratricopeptide (TPR) repeat protein